jgi:hypothetical protein
MLDDTWSKMSALVKSQKIMIAPNSYQLPFVVEEVLKLTVRTEGVTASDRC